MKILILPAFPTILGRAIQLNTEDTTELLDSYRKMSIEEQQNSLKAS